MNIDEFLENSQMSVTTRTFTKGIQYEATKKHKGASKSTIWSG